MNTALRVSLVQTDLLWRQPQQNRARLAERLAPLAGGTDLIVLPEMFTSGFTTEPDRLGDSRANSPTLQWLQTQAKTLNSAITGSTVFQTESGNTNRLWFVEPDGQTSYYDKVHLFRMAGEDQRYQCGSERKCVHYRGWRILLSVCYDLRFPVFCRNTNDYDVFLCVASWPTERRQAWRTLLQARAIENLCYSVGVNRVGVDGKGWHYSGDSMIVDYRGLPVLDAAKDEEFVATYTLDHQLLEQYRADFPAWQDADDFDLRLKQ